MLYIKNLFEAEITICENADSFLQSAMWGEFKSRFGWKVKAFLIEWFYNDVPEKLPLLVFCRHFALAPGLNFSFAYVPWGPQLPVSFPADMRYEAAAQLAKKLKPFLARNNVFVRFEPLWEIDSEQVAVISKQPSGFLSAGFKRAAATVQAPDTVIVDLSASYEEILSRMKPKWRYNISLAEKKGVKVSRGGKPELDIFYKLLKETAIRDGIAIHDFDYYKTLFALYDKENKRGEQVRLYTASHEGDILSAIVVLFRGKDATYLYGASSNIKRNLMSPYALQWKVMQDAKDEGCLYYDLFGIPPNNDPKHPMAGLYLFKTGFGGRIIHRPGGWDYPNKKLFYGLFNFVEALRKKLMNLRKKRK